MKRGNFWFGSRLVLLFLPLVIFSVSCGGGDGSGSSGTISMNVTDAKPMLPTAGDIESVTITFSEVSVHKSGGGWITLPLDTKLQPYKIDLYQFSDGTKTQFVPPVKLDSGKYTQVRIGVTNAEIRIQGENNPIVLEIPSENLKTDKNFEFDVVGGGAVDLTVDFDLSQSIVVTGNGTYQLKPVLHIVRTSEAATIQGTIDFGSSTQAPVTVIWDKYPYGNILDTSIDEEYTKITVSSDEKPPFTIFWLVPNEGYFVQVFLGDAKNPVDTYYVASSKLPAGAVYTLKESDKISSP